MGFAIFVGGYILFDKLEPDESGHRHGVAAIAGAEDLGKVFSTEIRRCVTSGVGAGRRVRTVVTRNCWKLRDADAKVQAGGSAGAGVIGNRGATRRCVEPDEGGDPIVIVPSVNRWQSWGLRRDETCWNTRSGRSYPQVQLQAALALLDLGDDKAKTLLTTDRTGQSRRMTVGSDLEPQSAAWRR